MRYLAIVLHLLMTVTFFICGTLLWKRRKEPEDNSRTFQALFSWFSAFFTLMFSFRTWAGTMTADGAFLEPEHTFVPIFIQMCYFFYPLEVVQFRISRAKVHAILFLPLFLLLFIGVCGGIEYTVIHTYSDLWIHLWEFNVWFRLFALTLMLFYCYALLLLPYDWRKSSASKKHILIYASMFCLMGFLHFAEQMTHIYWITLVHQVVWLFFFVLITYFEVKDRLLPSNSLTVGDVKVEPETKEKGLWNRIITALDEEEKWRDPELDLNTLSYYLHSNRTYVGDAVKSNTGMTFNEYINRRRINYVVEHLKQHPKENISQLFHFVGYTQRTTAVRNFQKVTGTTPAEFLDRIKH